MDWVPNLCILNESRRQAVIENLGEGRIDNRILVSMQNKERVPLKLNIILS